MSEKIRRGPINVTFDLTSEDRRTITGWLLDAVEPKPSTPIDRARLIHADDPEALLRLDLYQLAVDGCDTYSALQILDSLRNG
jgi:hypothetical protein